MSGIESVPTDLNFWADIWELAKNAGLLAVPLTIFLWWIERQDRREKEKLLLKLTIDVVAAMKDGTNVQEKLVQLISSKTARRARG